MITRLLAVGLFVFAYATQSFATPDYRLRSNLSGITTLSPKVTVHLDIQEAEEFKISADRIKDLVVTHLEREEFLGKSDVPPAVKVFVKGRSMGGGGGEWSIDIALIAPAILDCSKNQRIQVIVWQGSKSDHQVISYDPQTKKFAHPMETLTDRVYVTLRQVLDTLVDDLRIANPKKSTVPMP